MIGAWTFRQTGSVLMRDRYLKERGTPVGELVDAAHHGHDLEPFELADNVASGCQARCRGIERSAWVNASGLQYRLLDDRCAGRDGSD